MNNKIFSKTISIHLANGNPKGLKICKIHNWSGKAVDIPRNMIKTIDEKYLPKKAGVYILVGSIESSEKIKVYIGESENLRDRFSFHLTDETKDFFTKAIVFFDKGDYFNKAHARYLEYLMIKEAIEDDIAVVVNGKSSYEKHLSEEDEGVMVEFFWNMKVLLSAVNVEVFRMQLRNGI